MYKKALVLIAFTGLIGSAFGQNSEVQSAANYIRHKEYKKAKISIDKATENATSKGKAKTWKYCSELYYIIASSTKESIKSLDADALEKAFEAFKMLKDLDTKGIYKKESSGGFAKCGNKFFSKGEAAYKKEQFADGLKYFNLCTEAYDYNGVPKTGSSYYPPIEWGAYCAIGLKDYALAEKYYRMIIDAKIDLIQISKNASAVHTPEKIKLQYELDIFPATYFSFEEIVIDGHPHFYFKRYRG